jgi:hypothetical protein
MHSLRFVHPILLIAPLLMVRVRFMMMGWSKAAPAWVAPMVALLGVVSIVLLFVVERQFSREPALSRLRAKGQTPEYASALVGMVVMLAPVSWALGASFAGLSARQLFLYAGLSFVGLAYWGWRYRRVIYAV